MTNEADHADGAMVPPPPGFFRQFFGLAGGFWTSPDTRMAAIGLSFALLILGLAQIGMAVWLNFWNKDFFGALEAKNWPVFVRQIAVFAIIVVLSALTVAAHLHVKRRLQLGWRQWLSHHMIERWLHEGRQYQLLFMPGEHDNPDGRIAEDIRISTEFAVEFAHSILHCAMLLVSFLSILWALSDAFSLTIAGRTFQIPGYMVWVALAYAGAGSLLAFLLGRPLVRATDARQSREADFRFGLVRARENAEGVALLRGEADERSRLVAAFDGIRGAWNWQTAGQRRLMLLTNSYTNLATAFPLIIAAPRYFSGSLGLGGLMQTAQAFLQVQSALSWFVDNFPRFAEWRASAERVLSLHRSLADLEEDVTSIDENTITVTNGEEPVLALRGLVIAHPDGNVLVSDATGTFKPGERALIKGESGSGKSTLFRAVASLWPWGQGTIELPAGARLMFMPQRPYLPVGSLRAALLYPTAADSLTDETIAGALDKVGLGDFAARLDEEAQWDRVLSGGEQQRVAFARLLLHKPDWIFLDEATAALDEANQDKMMQLLIDELPNAGVLSVGHRPGLEAFHQRELVLVRGEEGARLTKASRARREAQRALQAAAKKRRGALVGRLRTRFRQRGKRLALPKLTPR